MKKTFTINLNGIVFHIDEDAYQALQQYIADISLHLQGSADTDEIIADIEARIGELFTDMLAQAKQEVVNMRMINSVIATMGNPSDFGSADESTPKGAKQHRKRLYRDAEQQILGGVASGVAVYLGWDPTIVRLLLIVCAIIGWLVVFPIYICLWIIVPLAETAAQRLEMQGEDVTINAIKQEFEQTKNYVESDRFKSQVQTLGQRVGKVFKAIAKIIFALIAVLYGIIAVITIAILGIVLFALLFGFGAAAATIAPFEMIPLFNLPTGSTMVGIVLLILVIGIPIYSLLVALIRRKQNKKKFSATYHWVSTITWVVALLGLCYLSISFFLRNSWEGWQFNQSNIHQEELTEVPDLPPFHSIDVTGNIELTLVQNPNQLLSLASPDQYLGTVTTQVLDSVLYIKISNMSRYDEVKAYLSTAQLRSIKAAGSTKINTENTLRQPFLNIELVGASKADMQLQIDSAFHLKVAGASKVELSGSAHEAHLSAGGASKIDALKLTTNRSTIYSAGASKIDVWCEEELAIQAYGASKVTYKGNPNIVKRITVGASKIDRN